MRYYEFIVEYKTDITRSNHGEKILDKLYIQHQIDSGFIGGPNGDYQNLALRVMGIPLNPYVDRRPVSPYSILTQELYDENKNKILDEMIGLFEAYDPTPNKQYTQYIIKWYLNDGIHSFPNIEDGTSTLRDSLEEFRRMKERLPERYRDIAQYTSAKNFMDSVQYFKEEYGKKEELPKGKSEIIYQTKDVTVRWAEDQEAACHLGQGTQWCTASTKADNYFDQYNKEGPLIIVNFTKPFTIRESVTIHRGTIQDKNETQIQKLQMHFTNSSEEEKYEYYDPGNWEVAQIANEADDVIEFNALYDSGPWNTNMGGDETYESPFKKMWDDSKFHNAIDKVWEHWRVE
tara:strand:- start:226 stop:1263 length:1038 start_codon:yes stop_codon:yes gene_type:complete